MTRYPHVAAYVTEPIWAVALERLAGILMARSDSLPVEIESRLPAQSGARTAGAVAVIPLHGVITHRSGPMGEFWGDTSIENLRTNLRAALSDPAVKSIVLDVDSPGGSVNGLQEMADEIYQARSQKHIVAQVNTLGASAAFWLASQADEIVVVPSGEVGSIGVIALHMDLSGAMAQAGITPTVLTAGKFKGEGNPYQPIDDASRGAIQERLDDYYGQFVGSVARGRGVPEATVRAGFGEGRIVGATRAKREGMIDRIGGLDDTIQRLASGTWRKPRGMGAEEDAAGIMAVPPDLDRRRRLMLMG